MNTYEVFKTLGHPIFVAKLISGDSTNRFVVLRSDDGILIGDEHYTHDGKSETLKWLGLDGWENKRIIIRFSEDEPFEI